MGETMRVVESVTYVVEIFPDQRSRDFRAKILRNLRRELLRTPSNSVMAGSIRRNIDFIRGKSCTKGPACQEFCMCGGGYSSNSGDALI
jgi:hypothetical protein